MKIIIENILKCFFNYKNLEFLMSKKLYFFIIKFNFFVLFKWEFGDLAASSDCTFWLEIHLRFDLQLRSKSSDSSMFGNNQSELSKASTDIWSVKLQVPLPFSLIIIGQRNVSRRSHQRLEYSDWLIDGTAGNRMKYKPIPWLNLWLMNQWGISFLTLYWSSWGKK